MGAHGRRSRSYATAAGVALVTRLDQVGRARPSLADRLAARALALAVDPAIPAHAAADALIRLACANPGALERALRRVRARGADRPSRLATGAADALRLARDRVADQAAVVSAEQVVRRRPGIEVPGPGAALPDLLS